MSLVLHQDRQTSSLRMEGTFTFESHAQFRSVSQDLLNATTSSQISLNLSALTYMDSSALGMLLLLRETAEAKGVKILLEDPSPVVMEILKVVQFVKLFEIRER